MAACEMIGGRRVLFVMAVGAEYGPQLQARFTPLLTGVGPIEAALASGIALDRLAAANMLPDLVVTLGSAGSRRCPLGEVFQVATISWRDMDASPLGFPRGVTPLIDHPPALPMATPLDWPTATLSTGADVVTGAAYAAIDADMVDMETFAVVRACQRYAVAAMGLRGISDGPGELTGLSDWTALLGHLDMRLAAAVDVLAEILAGGQGHDAVPGIAEDRAAGAR